MKWRLLICCVAVLILTSARMQRVEEVHSCCSPHSKLCLLTNNGLMAWMSMVVVRQDNQVLPRALPQSLTIKRKSTIIDRSAKYGVNFAISHDGRTLATTGSYNKIVLWDIATEQAIAELQTGPPWAAHLLFSPDDRWFMACTPKGEASVWDAKTGELKARLATGYKTLFTQIAIDNSRWLLATSDLDKPLIKLWDLHTGKLIRTFEHPPRQNPYNIFHPERETETKDGATDPTFTLDGRKLLSVSFLFSRIYVWDLESGKLEKTLGSHGSTIYRLVVDPTGRYLATTSRDRTASLWDLKTMELITSIGDFRGRVSSAAFGPDGRTLAVASADQDRKVKLWDVEGNRLIATLTGFKKNVVLFNENFSPDGKIVAVPSIGSYKPGLKLWDTKTGQLLATIDEAMQPVAFTPDGRTMLTGGPKSEVLLWDIVRN